jgi:uncharacterized protein YacL
MDVSIYGTEINILAVLAATLLFMVIGALWYSPVLFSKPWMKYVGKTEDQLNSSPAMYVIPTVGGLVLALTLAYLIGATNAYTLVGALRIAIATWGGFVFTSTFINTTFSGRHWKLALIDSGYFLVSTLLMAVIFHYWK